MSVPFRSKKSVLSAIASFRTPEQPLGAMIEIADRCNEVCVHCYQVQGQKGELPTSDWKAILDELASMGVLFLTISGGEATLRKDFIELVEYARSLKFAVKIFTNGLTMTPALAQTLADLAVQEVQISLYSDRAEVHDWVTGVKGSWERTSAGVRALVDAGVPTVVKTPLFSFNVASVDAYARLAASLGADFCVDPNLDPREDGDRTPESFAIGDDDYLRVMRDPTLTRVTREASAPPLTDTVCGACSGSVHIEANGEVRPCTQLAVPVGNAVTDGVRKAWQSGAARGIRSLTWGDLPGCRQCDLRSYCTRCFANARSQAGDALEPYEAACHAAKRRFEVIHGHAPTIVAEGDLDPRVGPYAREGSSLFRRFVHRRTEEDERVVSERPWVRLAPEPAVAAAGPGQLVQIRRPGAKHSRAERVPASRESDGKPPGAGIDRPPTPGHTAQGLD